MAIIALRLSLCICLLAYSSWSFGQSSPCLDYQPALTSSGTCSEGGKVALMANPSPNGTVFWYNSPSGGTPIAEGSFLVQNISKSDYFHAAERIEFTRSDTLQAGQALTTYTGATRGYYFQAPTAINISEIWVPTDASDAEQSLMVVSFRNKAPGNFNTPSTGFEILALHKNSKEASIPLNLTIAQGTYIGILGSRGDQASNSYAAVAPVVNFAGHAIPLQRLSMDEKLNEQSPHALYAEKGQSIGRIQFAYSFEDTCHTERSSVLAPVLQPGPSHYSGDTTCGPGRVNLSASPFNENSELLWYGSDRADAPILAKGDYFSPQVRNSRSFYVEEKVIINQHLTQPGPETTVLADTAKTRGFLFRAPNDFHIVGARVPTDAAVGPQNIAIVNFGKKPPHLSGKATNGFRVLAWKQEFNARDTILLDLSINKGDYIGVLGNRSDSSSLGLDHPILLINGDTAKTRRLGMSHRLASQKPQNLWTAETGGIGRVQLLVESYCVGPRKPVEAYVAPQPKAMIDAFNPTAPGARNGAIDLVVTRGTAPFNYYWSNGDESQDLQHLAAGNYDVNIVDANGCTYFLSQTLFDFDDAISLKGQPLRLFPNPTSGSSTLEIQGDFIPDDCRVHLLDGNGETFRQYAPADWNGQQLRIDLSGRANGTYFLRIEQDGEQQQMKLLKQ